MLAGSTYRLLVPAAARLPSWLDRIDFLSLLTRLALGLILLMLTFVVGRYARRRILSDRYLAQRDLAIATLFSNLAYVAILVLGILTALNIGLGISFTAVLTVFGATTLAVSLALQDVLRNFVAGVYILLEKPFNIGDRIALQDQSGEVLGIALRTTQLRTVSGAEVIVPNSAIMTSIVTNRSLTRLQGYCITASGERASLQARVPEVTSWLLAHGEVAKDPAPQVRLETLQGHQATISALFWVPEGGAAVATITSDLEQQLPGAAISVEVQE